MIFCVDKSVLKESPEVQRDIQFAEIMFKHTRYYPSVEEALKDNYVPFEFCTCVRSVYSNLVVKNEEHGNPLCYVNMTLTDKIPHRGEDLVMFMTSTGLMHLVDYADGFDEVMMKFSSFQPIGIYNPGTINPIFVSHVIIRDEGVDSFKKFCKNGVEFVSISSAKNIGGNIAPILDTLIEIKQKEENSNE